MTMKMQKRAFLHLSPALLLPLLSDSVGNPATAPLKIMSHLGR